MLSKRLAIALILVMIPALSAVSDVEKTARPTAPVPKPEWTPDLVVEFQIEALQHVDQPTKGAGIATTFRFASPQNREVTGPIDRFALLFQGPAFQPLIKHRIAGYGRFVQKDTIALREVTIVAADGQVFDYEFQLSRDPASGCWFTDGVIPNPGKPPIDAGKIARAF